MDEDEDAIVLGNGLSAPIASLIRYPSEASSNLSSILSTPSLQPVPLPQEQLEQPRPIPDPTYQSPYDLAQAALEIRHTQPNGEGRPNFSAQVSDTISEIRLDVRPPGHLTPISWPSNDLTDSDIARTGGRRGRGPRRRGSPKAQHNPITPTGSNEGTPIRRGRGSRPRGSRAAASSSRGSARGSARGGTAVAKRKRDNEDGHGDGHGEAMSISSDSSENFTPLPTQSRSGRKIFQAISTPIIKIDDEEVVENTTPRSFGSATASAPRAGQGMALSPRSPSSGRGGWRGRGAGSTRGGRGGGRGGRALRTPGPASVCKSCSRGHSPTSNAIVFCDNCNKGWHQFCHDPPVGQEVLDVPERQWFCADCCVLREESSRLGGMRGRTEGRALSLAEKRKHLQGMLKEELVGLLLHAVSANPTLQLFKERRGANGEVEDDVLPYPKAGNGLRLPPESEDLDLLIDDDTTTFSHTWEGIPEMLAAVQAGMHGMSMSAVRVVA